MKTELMKRLLADEVCVIWVGKYGYLLDKSYKTMDVSVQDTGAGLNFYKLVQGKWKRYERLLCSKCSFDPWGIVKQTKQGEELVLLDRVIKRYNPTGGCYV